MEFIMENQYFFFVNTHLHGMQKDEIHEFDEKIKKCARINSCIMKFTINDDYFPQRGKICLNLDCIGMCRTELYYPVSS